MTKFEVGRIYKNCYIGDSELYVSYLIIRRTEKSVWVRKPNREDVKRCKIYNYDNVESFYPDGRYSMALSIHADRPIEFYERARKAAKELHAEIIQMSDFLDSKN